MRKNEKDCQKVKLTLKKDLVKKYFNDREAYSQAKTEFIQRVLETKD